MSQWAKTNLEALMSMMDSSSTGVVGRKELHNLLENRDAIQVFNRMGVDALALVDLEEFIFQGNKVLPFHEFMELLMSLRGSNQATVKDIVDLRKCVLHDTQHLISTVSEL